MGDPSCFQILGGANPHTRTPWGHKKKVNRELAVRQWHGLGQTLKDLGVDVYVVPPVETSPGLVYPANAGFMVRAYEAVLLSEKKFVLSHPLPTRSAEGDVYGPFIKRLGIPAVSFEDRFEGEADFFPVGEDYIFTSGELQRQRFVPRRGWPPFKRIYGFRSSRDALLSLGELAGGKKIIPLTLVRETHYHGDTCLCSFGKNREFLMAYMPALSEASRIILTEKFKEKLLFLSEEDGEKLSANAFQIDGTNPVLVMPLTATERLRAHIRDRGVTPVSVDVSEFMDKGGGSVKCLIGDLGLLRKNGDDVSSQAREFRQEKLYTTLFKP